MTVPFNRPEVKVFSGRANRDLAQRVAQTMNMQLGELHSGRFADGEINLRIGETVRGHDVVLIQPTCSPVNENLMELLIMIDAFKRASANTITAVMPYFGYARQDRKARGRDPISAKLVANLLTVAGTTRVITMDLHADQIQGFFDIPLDNLQSFPIFVRHFLSMDDFNPEEYVVVSPDVGGVTRARRFAEKLKASIAILDKRRPRENVAEILHVIGDVQGKKAILVDDIIDTGRSLINSGKALLEQGALTVDAYATHAILSDNGPQRFEESVIQNVYTTNSIPQPKLPEMFKVLDIAPLLGEAVLRVRKNLSISILFR